MRLHMRLLFTLKAFRDVRTSLLRRDISCTRNIRVGLRMENWDVGAEVSVVMTGPADVWGWPIVCLADRLPTLLQAVLLPGNAASPLCYNVLASRLYSRTFDLLHMQPSAKGSKSLNANQSGRSRNSCVEMRVGILTRNFHQGLGLRGF